jgi:glycosyltransferase involved in cell wall biosynthesis
MPLTRGPTTDEGNEGKERCAVSPAPRVSIGLPVYNGENYLAESIEALLGQTYEDFELVISDNASTDSTPDICRGYGKQDSRIRYIRQPRNIGLQPNHNFVIREARGELFKMTSHDDLYARDLLKRCVEALDANPGAVLAHCWEAIIDTSGTVIKLLDYTAAVDAPRAPDRLRSLLFDGWDDYTYGVMRTEVLLRTRMNGSHHFADRTINTELCLHGPFYMVPEWLYFRRDHAERKEPYTVRSRCAYLDPRRASRLRHPVARLYAEYIWAYVDAIARAPMAAAEKAECYSHLARWLAGRAVPAVSRTLTGGTLQGRDFTSATRPDISVDTLVAGRDRRLA